jgi:hypothetical protein
LVPKPDLDIGGGGGLRGALPGGGGLGLFTPLVPFLPGAGFPGGGPGGGGGLGIAAAAIPNLSLPVDALMWHSGSNEI